jgi:hypothetical protein
VLAGLSQIVSHLQPPPDFSAAAERAKDLSRERNLFSPEGRLWVKSGGRALR